MEPETNNKEASLSATEESSSGSVKGDLDNKVFAIIGYFLPFLFFIPLLNEKSKDSSFSRFHSNQQLILLILIIALSFFRSLIMSIFMSLSFFIMDVVNIVIIILAIYGAYYAYKGEMKELSGIGKFKILN